MMPQGRAKRRASPALMCTYIYIYIHIHIPMDLQYAAGYMEISRECWKFVFDIFVRRPLFAIRVGFT